MAYSPEDIDKLVGGNSSGGYNANDIDGLISGKKQSIGTAPSSLLRRAADIPIGLARGVAKLPNVVVGLADIATGGKTGKFIEDTTGYDFSAADKFYNPMLSPETQAAQQKVSQSFRDDGFVRGLGTAIANPSAIAQTVAESAPSMLGGAGLARLGIGAVSKFAPALATKLAPLAVGAGEGAVTAGQIAEDIRIQNPDRELSLKQAGLAGLAGLGTMGIGAAGSKFAGSAIGRKLGLTDIDSALAGVGREAVGGATPNIFKRTAAGAGMEGAEELAQSTQEQALQNIAQGKAWNDGLAEAAGMGLLSGGLMGGGASAAFGGRKPNAIDANLTANTQPATTGEIGSPVPEVTPSGPLSKSLEAAGIETPKTIHDEMTDVLNPTVPNDEVTSPLQTDPEEDVFAGIQPATPEADVAEQEPYDFSAELPPLTDEQHAEMAARIDLGTTQPQTPQGVDAETGEVDLLQEYIKSLPKAKRKVALRRMGEAGGEAIVRKQMLAANPEYAPPAVEKTPASEAPTLSGAAPNGYGSGLPQAPEQSLTPTYRGQVGGIPSFQPTNRAQEMIDEARLTEANRLPKLNGVAQTNYEQFAPQQTDIPQGKGDFPVTAGLNVSELLEKGATNGESTNQATNAEGYAPQGNADEKGNEGLLAEQGSQPDPAKQPWEMTRDEYIADHPETTKGSEDYDRALNLARMDGTITQQDFDKKAIRNSMGYKEFWAKTRKELEQEGKDAVKAAKAERASINKLTGGKDFAPWRIKSMSTSAKNTIDYTIDYNKSLLDVHKERVQEALSEGKPVPAEVLADYPDLKPADLPPAAETVTQPVEKPGADLSMQFRTRTTSNNSFSIMPPVSKKFTDADKTAISEWGKAQGHDVVVSGNGFKMIAKDRHPEQPTPPPTQAALKKQTVADAKEAAKQSNIAARAAEYEVSPAKQWIESNFTGDSIGAHNRQALARFLTGTDKKFQGLANHKWQTTLEKLGVDSTDSNFAERLRDVYQEQKAATKPSTPPSNSEIKPETVTYRTADETGFVNDGKGGIKSGDVFKTSSGRMTTPFPKQKGQKYLSQWIVDNAVAEAESRGDKWNAGIFKNTTMLKGGNLTTADGDSMHQYLYGEQPAVLKPFLKPLASPTVKDSLSVAPTLPKAQQRKAEKVKTVAPKAMEDLTDAEIAALPVAEKIDHPVLAALKEPGKKVKTTVEEVVTEAVKVAKEEGTPLKEQKKYLLENLDQAIKEAPEDHVDMEGYNKLTDHHAGKRQAYEDAMGDRAKALGNAERLTRWLEDGKIGTVEFTPEEIVKYQAELLVEQNRLEDATRRVAATEKEAKATKVPITEQFMVTIHVPDDGTFQVYNTKSALKQFKEQVSKMFPAGPESKPKEGYGNLPKPRGGQSLTQMDGVDFKTTSGEWHTNGHVLVKGKAGVPLKVDKANSARWEGWKTETPENNSAQIARVIPEDKHVTNKAETITYVNTNSEGTEGVSDKPLRNTSADSKKQDALYVVAQSGDKFVHFNAEYFNYINKLHPKAEWFINDKPTGPAVAKVNGETVAVVMPMREALKSNVIKLVKDYIGYKEAPKPSRSADAGDGIKEHSDILERKANEQAEGVGLGRVGPPRALGADDGRRIFSETFSVQGNRPVPASTIHAAPDSGKWDGLQKIASVFGKTVFLVSGEAQTLFKQQAFVNPNNPQAIFIRSDATSPALSILGHELTHTLKIERPELYQKLHAFLDLKKGVSEEYNRDYNSGRKTKRDTNYTDEELIAELVGVRFSDKSFWQGMAEKEPSLFRGVTKFVKGLMDKITRALGSANTSEYFTSVKRAEALITEVMADYAKQQGSNNSSTGQDSIKGYSGLLSSRSLADVKADTFEKLQETPYLGRVLTSVVDSGMVVSRWGRTVGTMYHISQQPAFKNTFGIVYRRGQQFISDIARYASKAEELAPTIFPKTNLFNGLTKFVSKEDNALISKALHEGTLENGPSPTNGVIWSDEQLLEKYGIKKDSPQYKMYHEALAATNRSLEDMAKSTMYGVVLRTGEHEDFRDLWDRPIAEIATIMSDRIQGQIDKLGWQRLQAIVDANLFPLEKDEEKVFAEYEKLAGFQKSIKKLAITTKKLQTHGYFPLSRFGDFTVTVREMVEGKASKDVEFYGQYENNHDAALAQRQLQKLYPGYEVVRSPTSKEEHKLYSGLTLEAVELFAEHMNAEDVAPYQEYLKKSLNNRSAMKHMINRKGTAGYNTDGVRTLANFIYSNSRFTSKNLNMVHMRDAAAAMEKNDLKDTAMRLVEYLNNPVDEASKLRGFLFIQYLGGSIASGITNLTQVPLMLVPYLNQHAKGMNVAKVVGKAWTMALSDVNNIKDTELRKAMLELAEEGHTEPQEIHQLTATASNRLGASNPVWNAALKSWGSIFSVTEVLNRKTSAIAAFQIAKMNGKSYAEAKQAAIDAIDATQGIYNKGNRPEWARGPVLATLFTFKQFSVMYLELFMRLPAKQKLVMMGMLMLAAGAEGLPFAGDLEDLIDTFGQWFGYNTNSKRAFKEFADKTLGKDASRFVREGISAFAPIDVQGRLGAQNLIPGTGILKQSSTDKTRDITEFFGPAGGLVTALGDSLALFAKGELARGAKAMAPRAIQGMATGIEMAATGQATDKHGRKTFDTTPTEAVYKGIGFNPSRMAEESRVKSNMMQDKQLFTVRKDEIVTQWAQAIIAKDSAEKQDAIAKWRRWNKENPEMRITGINASVTRKVKSIRMSSADRFLKSTPKGQRRAAMQELSS